MNSTDSLAGFTLWPGGECPVPPDTMVECIVRGCFPVVKVVRSAFGLRWEHRRDGGDIIAYRVVAPEWRLPDPPAGKQWHRTDGWTQDMLPDGYRPLLLGEVEQKSDEYYCTSGWCAHPVVSKHGARPYDNLRRTRRPLPSSPKPWDGQGDVPGPVCWLRRKGDARIEHGLVNSVYCFGLRAEGYGFKRWIDLSDFEHSTDRKTWHPCVRP